MAQTGYTPIQLYYSTTASAVPTNTNLANGELAINITDGKLYYKDNTGTVKLLAGAGGAGIAGGSNTQVQYNSSGNLAGDADLTFDGTTLSTAGLTASGTVTLSGGTANGVTYLNGSKVLTSGSALTFDGTNFVVNNGYIRANNTLGYYTNLTATGLTNFATSMDFNSVASHIFSINSSEIFRTTSTSLYTASGINVGIGTSSPSQKLEVSSGAAQFNGGGIDGTFGDAILFGNSSFPTVQKNRIRSSISAGAESNLLSIETSTATAGTYNSNQLVLRGDGNVGIGTSSPSEKLTVNGNIKLGTSGTSWIYGPATTGRSIYSNSDSTAYIIAYGSAYGGSNDAGLQFTAGTSNNMVFNSAGNLGLGVTPSAWSSSAKALEIGIYAGFYRNASGITAMSFNSYQNTSNNDTYRVSSNPATKYEMAGGHAWYIAPSGTAGNAISFSQAMTLDASGRLVIGSTTANAKLNVNTTTYSAVTNGEQVLIEGTSAWQQGLAFSMWGAGIYNSGYASGYIGVPNTSNSLYISGGAAVVDNTATGGWAKALNTSSASFMVVGGGNTIFYGNTGLTANTIYSPTQRAQITAAGGFSVGTTADPGAGAIYATGAITAFYSDARLKTVSGKIENALDKVAKLSGVYYTNNDTAKSFGYTSDEVQVGVLAQEIEAVLPQVVKAAPFDLDENGNSKSGQNYKTVQYEKLVPLLIEAINELRAEVTALKGTI